MSSVSTGKIPAHTQVTAPAASQESGTVWKGSLVYLQLMLLVNWPGQSDWTVALQTFLVVEKEMQQFFPSLSYGS